MKARTQLLTLVSMATLALGGGHCRFGASSQHPGEQFDQRRNR